MNQCTSQTKMITTISASTKMDAKAEPTCSGPHHHVGPHLYTSRWSWTCLTLYCLRHLFLVGMSLVMKWAHFFTTLKSQWIWKCGILTFPSGRICTTFSWLKCFEVGSGPHHQIGPLLYSYEWIWCLVVWETLCHLSIGHPHHPPCIIAITFTFLVCLFCFGFWLIGMFLRYEVGPAIMWAHFFSPPKGFVGVGETICHLLIGHPRHPLLYDFRYLFLLGGVLIHRGSFL